MRRFVRGSGLAAALAAATAAGAQPFTSTDAAGIALHTEIETIATATGDAGAVVAKLVEPADLEPGDEVVYTIRFVNEAAQPAGDLRITSAVPSGMHYRENSAAGPGAVVLYSVDGGITFGLPEELFVMANTGRRRATAADYTHVRWVLGQPLAPGATGFARFRAVRE